MADQLFTPPPTNLNGISRPMRGKVVEKPKNLKETLRRLWLITDGQRKGLGIILLLSALSSLSSVFSPYLTGNIVSAIAAGNSVTTLLIMLCLLYVANWLIHFLQQYRMASIGQRIIAHIRMALFNHMKTLPLSFFDRRQHGELMSRLTNDIDNISTTISNSLTQLLTYFFTIGGIFVMMLSLSPLLTIISLFGILLVVVLTRTVTRRTRKLFSERQKALGQLNGQVEETISGMQTVKAYCREEQVEKEFQIKNERLKRTAIHALIISGYLMPLTNVINNLCYLVLAVFSGILFINGKIGSIGLITSFLLYVRQFVRPFVEIANIYNNFQTAVAGAERVFEIMDEQSEPEDKADALPLVNPKGRFVLQHVNFGYSPEKLILKDINLDIPAGTQVAVVGPTGSGKTTLINLLTRFYDVSDGQIFLDGHDLRDYRLKSLRDCFGVVLQDTALFAISVMDNIRYGNPQTTEEEVIAAARSAGADGFIMRLPDGYHTMLSQGGEELSQGERQLLTIARAILCNAPIIILDEATSSVDTVTERKIQQAMRRMCQGRTSFIIAHRLSTIRDADLILLLEDGQVKEAGSHSDLMELNGGYARLYRRQSGEELSEE